LFKNIHYDQFTSIRRRRDSTQLLADNAMSVHSSVTSQC